MKGEHGVGDAEDRKLIDGLRRRIDDLDRRLTELLNERSRCALAIGAAKRRMQQRIYDPQREAAIVRQVVDANTGPLTGGALTRLFERILDESRRMERLANEPESGGMGEDPGGGG